MKSLVDLGHHLGQVPGAVVTTLGRVDVGRGREELFRHQLSELLTELAHRAVVASITASSALEGVVVADQARATAIIDGRAATLRTRSEQELAGYRAALEYLFTRDWRPLNVDTTRCSSSGCSSSTCSPSTPSTTATAEWCGP